MSDPQPVKPPLLKRVAAMAPELLAEAAGIAGYGLVNLGVFVNWGQGWALIAAGAPLAALYVWHSIRAARRRGTAE